MLTTCPECDLQVSDKAEICPHCGYPLKQRPAKYKQSSRRKKLPNGFGQITELKGKNLRKPFRAMVTIGHYENGRPIQKTLKPEGYFRTYNDAYAALVEYNKNPYDLNKNITVKQLYDRWLPVYAETLKNESSIRNTTAVWAYCSSVYDISLRQLRPIHIKNCIDSGSALVHGEIRTASPSTKSHIKSLFNVMLDYAVEYELTDRNVSRMFALSDKIEEQIEDNRVEHIAFSPKELRELWQNINDQTVDMMLIQCYMGWRPGELVSIVTDSVDLSKNIIIGGSKTDAGIDRTVPIHSLVREIIKKYYDEAVLKKRKYLFYSNGRPIQYRRYYSLFMDVVASLSLDPGHRPHDGRKTYITMAKYYSMDEYAIKKIVGHEIDDVTEKIYTERPLSWLREETEKIKKDYITGNGDMTISKI